MASVTPVKRKTGYGWRVQARNADGKMRQETFYSDDPREAEQAARQFARLVDRVGITEAARIRDERDGQSGTGVPTLAQWIDTYLDKESGILRVNDGTRAGYRAIVDATIIPRLGELPVNVISADDVAKWIVWLEGQPSKRRPGQRVAGKTVKNHHALLSAILATADARGLRTGNPARGAKVTRTRRERMTVLTQSEFATLLRFVPDRWKPLVMWLAGTGMRWGEATALTWGDVDRDADPMLVHVDKAWQKSDTAGGVVLGPPKTDAGERTISVPDALVAVLGRPGAGDALVFSTGKGTRISPGSFYSRVWKLAVDAANDPAQCEELKVQPLGKRPRVHDLRHCHASWLIAGGRPLPYIQARLGHEKITTTVGTYGHLLPDAQQGDADAVALALSAILPVQAVRAQVVAEEPAQLTA